MTNYQTFKLLFPKEYLPPHLVAVAMHQLQYKGQGSHKLRKAPKAIKYVTVVSKTRALSNNPVRQSLLAN